MVKIVLVFVFNLVNNSEVHSEPSQTDKIELKTVNRLKPLTIFAKASS